MPTLPTPALLVTIALQATGGDTVAANRLVVESGYAEHPLYLFACMVQLAKCLTNYQGGDLMVQSQPDGDDLERLVLDFASAVLANETARFNELARDAFTDAGVLQREALMGALLSFGAGLMLDAYSQLLPATNLG